jgi:hypothetical protein
MSACTPATGELVKLAFLDTPFGRIQTARLIGSPKVAGAPSCHGAIMLLSAFLRTRISENRLRGGESGNWYPIR